MDGLVRRLIEVESSEIVAQDNVVVVQDSSEMGLDEEALAVINTILSNPHDLNFDQLKTMPDGGSALIHFEIRIFDVDDHELCEVSSVEQGREHMLPELS